MYSFKKYNLFFEILSLKYLSKYNPINNISFCLHLYLDSRNEAIMFDKLANETAFHTEIACIFINVGTNLISSGHFSVCFFPLTSYFVSKRKFTAMYLNQQNPIKITSLCFHVPVSPSDAVIITKWHMKPDLHTGMGCISISVGNIIFFSKSPFYCLRIKII